MAQSIIAVVSQRSLSAADPMAVHVSLTALCTTMQHHTSADCAALRISLVDARRENAALIGENADWRRDEKYMRDRARAESQAADSWKKQCVSVQTTLQTTREVAAKYLQRYRYSKDEKDLERALHALAPSSSSLTPVDLVIVNRTEPMGGQQHFFDTQTFSNLKLFETKTFGTNTFQTKTF